MEISTLITTFHAPLTNFIPYFYENSANLSYLLRLSFHYSYSYFDYSYFSHHRTVSRPFRDFIVISTHNFGLRGVWHVCGTRCTKTVKILNIKISYTRVMAHVNDTYYVCVCVTVSAATLTS